MIKGFFKKWAKEEIEDALKKLNFHLSNSFFNVKKDMDTLTSRHSHTHNKTKYLEQRIEFIEKQLLTLLSSKPHHPVQEEKKVPSLESIPLLKQPEMVLNELTDTQKALLVTIYQHQIEMDTPLTIKYLAETLYPGRYNQVRTTLIEYLEVLSSYGLVNKIRKKRLIYTHVTKKGEAIVEAYLKNNQRKSKKLIK